MFMKKGLKLLSDSGLPVEQEAERNVEEIVQSCRADLESMWNEKGMSAKTQYFRLQIIRRVVTKDLKSAFEEEIKKRRESY
ncbi:MAG: hypothetical protein JXR76_15320 [Deltaproteobacteria bacterium]|nr:hypothetical protein [Deltaproteobacteria bacterium]